LVTASSLFSTPGYTQSIKLDGSLSARTTLSGPAYTIPHDLGQTRGANLFHSFEQFNVLTGESATFTGPNTISRVISRVIGGVQSFIDGLLATNFAGAKPEFYLVNPSGLMFGPNASLNVSGSVHFSTADYLRFADQIGQTGLFAKLSETTTLSVDPVAAFGFMGPKPAAITMQGSALQVLGSQSLSVIGGDLSLSDATLVAPSGNVNLISVGSPGTVLLLQSNAWDVSSFSNLGQISAKMTTGLTTKPSVDVSGDGSGTMLVRGGQLVIDHALLTAKTTGIKDGAPIAIDISTAGDVTVTNGGELSAGTRGPGRSGDMQIKASGQVLVTGSCTFQDGPILRNRQSQITSISELGATGRGSDITMNAARLEVTEGGQLTLRTQDTGRGGDAALDAAVVRVYSSQPLASSNILAITERTGTAGDLRLTSQDIEMGVGGSISNRTSMIGEGQNGSILIDATGGKVRVSGVVSADSRNNTPAGNVSIQADAIALDGIIETVSISGDGGKIKLKADTLTIDGKGGGAGTPAATGGNIKLKDTFTSSANIGAIDIDVTNLMMVNKAEIAADRLVGPGKAGGVTINADEMLMDRSSIHATVFSAEGAEVKLETRNLTLRNESLISTQTLGNGIGNAGNITVNTDNLTLLDGSPISSSTFFGPGRAGSVTVHAKGTVTVSGVRASDPLVVSGLLSATSGPGDAGTVSVQARDMFVRNGGLIATLSDGTGNAGLVDLKVASHLELSGGGIISSETRGAGKGGSVTIQADRIGVTGRDSGIFANTYASIADFGLNLDIQHTFDSDLTAVLISPQGTQVSLFSGVGGSSENFVGTRLDDRIGSPIQGFAFAPFTGNFTPRESFGRLIGEPVNGTWQLAILDSFRGDEGTLFRWSLDIGNNRLASTTVPVAIKDNAVAVSSLEVNPKPQAAVNAVQGETARGGDITLNARTTEISDEGIISASTYGTGLGGTITANVSEDLLLQEGGGISASTLRSGVGAGNAGTVTLTAAGTL
jgi:filamentous hemagglutinin family protein